MPWVYRRREIAARWHCAPPDVDEYPAREIELELRLMDIESKAETFHRKQQELKGPAHR